MFFLSEHGAWGQQEDRAHPPWNSSSVSAGRLGWVGHGLGDSSAWGGRPSGPGQSRPPGPPVPHLSRCDEGDSALGAQEVGNGALPTSAGPSGLEVTATGPRQAGPVAPTLPRPSLCWDLEATPPPSCPQGALCRSWDARGPTHSRALFQLPGSGGTPCAPGALPPADGGQGDQDVKARPHWPLALPLSLGQCPQRPSSDPSMQYLLDERDQPGLLKMHYYKESTRSRRII